MENYVLEPKRTQLMVARIADEQPTFTVEVPDTDAELAAIVGTNADGTPKLTLKSLAQEAIANKIQAAISKYLAEGAETVKDAAGKVTGFVQEQYATEAELLEILRKAPTEAYRLLVGERASGGGRKSAAKQVEEAIAGERTKQVELYRGMIANADAASRPIFLQMASALGYTELLG